LDDRRPDRRRGRARRESDPQPAGDRKRVESPFRAVERVHMTEKHIVVAHSPDSDDAFMFYGLASENVDTGGIVVDQVLSDIETLNPAAFGAKDGVRALGVQS